MKNRLARTILAISFIFWIVGNLSAQQPTYSPEAILKVEPTQKGIVVDYPAADDVAKCEITKFKEGGYEGVCLTKPDGATPLRVWCAQAGATKVEQVRFYRNGNEVFRDILGVECRWMGEAGSKRGLVNERKEIVKWQSISPEEATAEMVAAIVTGDLKRYRLVSLSGEELNVLGVADPLAAELLRQTEAVAAGFNPLVTRLSLPPAMTWGAFNGAHPALLPQGRSGLTVDLPAYFNSNVVLMNRDDASQSHQLYVGDMVRVGEAWKIIGLPQGEPFGNATGEVAIVSTLFPTQVGEGAVVATNEYNSIAEEINEIQARMAGASSQEYPVLCDKAYRLLLTLATKNPQEEVGLVTQAADLLFTAAQSGIYPQGISRLEELYGIYKDGSNKDLAAHIRLRQIDGAFYAVTQATPRPRPAEMEKAQTQHSEELAAFVDEYPQTISGAMALVYLAMNQEYLQENEKALSYYSTINKNFGKTAIGKKAAGAVNRLSSEGQPLVISKWKLLEGGELNLADYRGKTTALFAWASWTPDDVDRMKQLLARHPALQVVGICLDQRIEDAAGFIKSNGALPWKSIFEPNGLDGAIAMELGIPNVPMIILLDAQGNVISPNIMSVDDVIAFLKD